jgi:hypothetical protein
MRVQIGVIWVRLGFSGQVPVTTVMSLGFREQQAIPWQATTLASQQGICLMQLAAAPREQILYLLYCICDRALRTGKVTYSGARFVEDVMALQKLGEFVVDGLCRLEPLHP